MIRKGGSLKGEERWREVKDASEGKERALR
jgi:hypothetical protein